jgi:hypothetical protein
MADDIKLTFTEKTTGRWDEIFKEFLGNNERMMHALRNPGKGVPNPFDLSSKRDGFRLAKDYNTKNGLGFDNSKPGSHAISGVKMIAFLTGQTENQVSSNIHKFLDGKTMDIIKIRADIETQKKERHHRDLEKLEFNRNMIRGILNKPVDNSFRDKYLESRGLKDAIPFINNDIRGIPELEYFNNKQQENLPAMVSIVRNEDHKIAFLHRTYLDKNGNKADVENTKKTTGGTREDAYQRPFFAQVNNPKDNSGKNIHICEGVETALAVAVMTKNKDQVISAVNANGVTKFRPPANNKNVTIWADYDVAGMKAAIDLQNTIGHQTNVKINLPESGFQKDFLDDLNQGKSNQQKAFTKNTQDKGISR